MPLDAPFLRLMTTELDRILKGGRVDKVLQPERDEIVLQIRAGGENHRLVLCVNSSAPRILLSSLDKENPKTPPMFCMLLRKHLSGARVEGIRQLSFERVVEVAFTNHTELGDLEERSIIIELIGRQGNLILTGPGGRIIDSIRRIDISEGKSRQIIPGVEYELPDPMGKINPVEDFKAAETEIGNAAEGQRIEDILVSRVMGISPLIAREVAFRASGDTAGMLTAGNRADVTSELGGILDAVIHGGGTPVLLIDPASGPKDYSFIGINQYGGLLETVSMDSFSALLDEFYSRKELANSLRRRSANLRKTVENLVSRASKKLSARRADLAACEKREEYRIMGELVTANLALVKKGDRSVKVGNYYEEGMPELEIPLDPVLSPNENAQKYYKRYRKLKTAADVLIGQIEAAERELAYLLSVRESLSLIENEADISAIMSELAEEGFQKDKSAGERKSKSGGRAKPRKSARDESRPMEFETADGFRIVAGKNNRQNDELSLRVAGRGDIWFHAEGRAGSHVILFSGGREPSDEAVLEAANIAAIYSGRVGDLKAEIQYTDAKNLKKPPGSPPGLVTFSTHYSITVVPNAENARKIRVK